MDRKLWWVTRPTRDLHDIEEALKSFTKIARGKQWRGARELHKKFEKCNPAKTSNVGMYGSEGSGGRTWAAWLRMWGLWYNEHYVNLTDAGNLIVSTKDPQQIHNQIVHQIMTFQITSAYHENLNQKQEDGFQIFPFRFILKLLLNGRIKQLDTDEIGLLLLQVKNPNEYSGVVDKIIEWRKKTKNTDRRVKLKTELLLQHKKKYANPRSDSPDDVKKYWQSIRDVANTIMINISYIKELKYDNKSGTISIRNTDRKNARELFDKYNDVQFSRLYTLSENAFARRFGIRYDRRKASNKDTSPMTPARKQRRRIMTAIQDIQRSGKRVKGFAMIQKIHEVTNYPVKVIEQVVSENTYSRQVGEEDAEFLEYYLYCAKTGQEHAEFEKLTRTIFTMMGFETEKRKIPRARQGGREIDGLVLNREINMSGILECKAGSKYTFPVGDCTKMQNIYMEHFQKKRIGGITYTLDFFVYVIGQQVSGLENFKEIIEKTNMRGSIIYAADLMLLYCLFKQGKITPIKAWSMFKCNKCITQIDIENAVMNHKK